MAKKKTPQHFENKVYRYISWVLVGVIVIAAVYFVVGKYSAPGGIAAVVNGEKITLSDLNQKYEKLPGEYKMAITKDFLLDQLINTLLLLQEAGSKGIEVTDGDIDAEIESIKAQDFHSDNEFEKFLKDNNIELDELREQMAEQLMINTLLEQEILSKIEVSESRINSFYERNKESFGNASYEIIKEQINRSILQDLSTNSIQVYIEQLRVKSVILKDIEGKLKVPQKENAPESKEAAKKDDTLKKEETAKGGEAQEKAAQGLAPQGVRTFNNTGSDICREGGKPVIRFYGTSKCAPCAWIKDTLLQVLGKNSDKVAAYYWELDSGDNLITGDKEEGIPRGEVDIFNKYNPKSTVPFYIFGCRYARSGNGYDSLEEEKREFEEVISELVA